MPIKTRVAMTEMNPLTTPFVTDQEAGIFAAFESWAEAVRSLDMEDIDQYVLPNSDFWEITTNCRQLLELGIKCNYEFSDLRVLIISGKCDHARVRGKVKLTTSGSRVCYSGNFSSKCLNKSINGSGHCWKLGDIRIDWD